MTSTTEAPRTQRDVAEVLLQTAVGDPQARFHPGQWEAIDALTNRREKLMVVQRTGWGKSVVYFISTSLLRQRGAGPTIIVSPLLALMRNQVAAARRLGLKAETINSGNAIQWPGIVDRILSDEVDVFLISPERLANDAFAENVLQPVADRVGLLVVDEAHCISDWGHDFRPDYKRLVNVLRQLPPNTPLLGTTATANNRVIQDIQNQLGDIAIRRGPLIRRSLILQTIQLSDQAARMSWLAEALPRLPGTGIIYTLTKRDAEQVATWLRSRGINAQAYHSTVEHEGFADTNHYRQHLEEQLLNNDLKALVATTALGMGYDKPDLGFVIHFQAPSSVVAYYQQVGRAGRAIDRAYGLMLVGGEDAEIHEYFRRNAFPAEQHVAQILQALADSDGLTIRDLESRLNLRYGQIDKTLKVLSVENPAPVIRVGSTWRRTPVNYRLDSDHIRRLTLQREREWQEIQDYIESETCLMNFLRAALDDPTDEPCGRCAVCRGKPIVSTRVSKKLAHEASRLLSRSEIPFRPKQQVANGGFPNYGFRGNLPPTLQACEGRILSRWKDGGWGHYVAEDKRNGYLRDELVEAMAEMITLRWCPEPRPVWLTCVPSVRHPELVPDFARRLAARLSLPFVDAIEKVKDNQPQKLQQNRFYQCRNLDGAFAVTTQVRAGPAFLVDDMIDSGWTMAVLAALLRRAGCSAVFPVALASTSTGN